MSIRKLKSYVSKKFNENTNENLSYHNLEHTLYVLKVCNDYIKRLKIEKHDAHLLRTAALVHDLGILDTYREHEEQGVGIINELLPSMNYSPKDIKRIEGMIMATKLPQNPQNILEKIICDADLDYLGTKLFYPIGNTLFEEFLAYNVVNNEKEWDELQINFLSNHSYHTDFAKKNREPKKVDRLNEIKEKWNLK